MKKILIFLLLLLPSATFAQYDGLPVVGIPSNTNCISFGNNGVCNTFSPAGPSALTSTFLIPSAPNDGSFKQALIPIDTLGAYFRKFSSLNLSMVDWTGDSRTANMNTGSQNYYPGSGLGTTSLSWFIQANALAGNRYVEGLQVAGSGCRSDQFLAKSNIQPMLDSPAQWFGIGPYMVNDLVPQLGNALLNPITATCGNVGTPGAFPFVNNNGVTVTQSNVGQVSASNVITAAQLALNAGKNVIIIAEMGATTTSVAGIGQMYDANARVQAWASGYPGRVFFIDFGPSIYIPNSSATAVAFASGFSSDGTHPLTFGASLEAPIFNNAVQSFFPPPNSLISNINNINTTNSRQLISNPLMTTLTGGSLTGCNAGSTGNVPASWTFSCSNTNITLAVTSAASTWCNSSSNCGNDITVAVTCAATGTVTLSPAAPSNALWNLTDQLQFKANVSVASGSSNFAIYATADVNSNLGTINHYSLQNGSALFGAGLITAYNWTLATSPGGAAPGSTTKGFTVAKIQLYCPSATGNGTITFNRASFERIYNYSTSAGFTGQ